MILDWHVAGITTSEGCRLNRFAVVKLRETPAASRSGFFRVLNHKLHVCSISRHERLRTTEDLVVFLGGHILPGEPGNDCTVRERKLTFPIGFDRDVVA